MAKINQSINQERVFWGKKYLPLPGLDLLAIQKESYDSFLNGEIARHLIEISPIEDFTGKNWSLSFLKHRFDPASISPLEAVRKGITYDAPLKVLTRLTNKRTGEAIEQEVFFGDIPVMTQVGTFIINGIERAVVNQLVRSAGVFFSGKIDPGSGLMLYEAELRPLRGSWLQFLVAKKNVITGKNGRQAES